MTKRPEIWDKSVIRASVGPSLKYSCFGSSLMLTKRRTSRQKQSLHAGLRCYHDIGFPWASVLTVISSIRAQTKVMTNPMYSHPSTAVMTT